MNFYAKCGVSNWTLTFETGEEILIDTVNEEVLTYFPDETVTIKITDCIIRKDLRSLFKKGSKVASVKQEAFLRDGEGNDHLHTEIYNNLHVVYSEVYSQIGEIECMDIFLASNAV